MSTNSLLDYCRACNGMLPDSVYEALHGHAMNLKDGAVVEIGTAHGAATTAIAFGLMEQSLSNQIFTVDTYGGRFSSRSIYGSPEENFDIVKTNFASAGIEHIITMFKGTSDSFANSGM